MKIGIMIEEEFQRFHEEMMRVESDNNTMFVFVPPEMY